MARFGKSIKSKLKQEVKQFMDEHKNVLKELAKK